MPNQPPAPGPAAPAGAAQAPAAAGRADAAQPADAPGRLLPPVVSMHVVRGEPTEAELAAVIAVLAARSRAAAAAAAAPEPAAPARSAWSAKSRLLRESVTPGPGAWKRSALPR